MRPLLFALALCGLPLTAQSIESLAGVWEGSLQNDPARAGAREVRVRRTIGNLAPGGPDRVPFLMVSSEDGRETARKPYQLCRGDMPGAFFIDGGGGFALRPFPAAPRVAPHA